MEDVRWGVRSSHTKCEPCLLGLAIEAKILPMREPSVQHVEGSSDPPPPASEVATKALRFHRVGITFPLAFCLTDRSAIVDKSPIERMSVRASGPVLLR
jgi:hypothetical protein